MSAPLWVRTLRAIGVDLRGSEARIAGLLFFYSFLLGVFQFSSKAIRQASYIDSLSARELPFVYLAVAVLAFPVLRIYDVLAHRATRDVVVIGTAAVVATGTFVFWVLMEPEELPRWVAFTFYLWIALTTVLLLTQLWSYVNTVLDPRQARRLFGFIGAGSMLGGVLGGMVASLGAYLHEPRSALLAAVVVLLGIIGTVLVIESWSGQRSTLAGEGIVGEADAAAEGGVVDGLSALRSSAHLRLIAGVLLVTVVVAQMVDLQFNSVVENNTTSLDERAQIFGWIFSVMGLAAFVFQLVLTPRIHGALGVGFAMRVLPVFVLLMSSSILVAAPISEVALVWLIGALKIGDNGLRYSLDHTTRELLFVPVPAAQRVVAKGYVDVLVHRFAKGVAAVILLTVTFGWLDFRQVSWLVLAFTVLWLLGTQRAQWHYVEALRAGLNTVRRGGSTDDVWLDPRDVTTLEVLVESLGSVDPRRVVRSIELLEAHGRARLVPPVLLHHQEPEVRLRTLDALIAAERRDALPLIEQRLADREGDVRIAAIRALARLSDRDRVELMRARVDDADPRVRAAAISCVLDVGQDEAAAEASAALEEMLGSEDPVWRCEAAKALGELPDPKCQEVLVRLLFDTETEVAKAAIDAVQRRQARSTVANPLYVPILISKLRDRRLKHEAREAIVACGDSVLPALQHFVNDRQEDLWVRRALPRTIARFGNAPALATLYRSLDLCEDRLLRRKILEGIVELRKLPQDEKRRRRELQSEVRLAVRCFLWEVSLVGPDGLHCHGPLVRWEGERPVFLARLLDDRRRGHIDNVFRLLSVGPHGTDYDQARAYLWSGERRLQSKALEYLDNVLPEPTRRSLMMLLDDLPLVERLQRIERIHGLRSQGLQPTLEELIDAARESDDFEWVGAAALHEVARHKLRHLYRRARLIAAEGGDGVLVETAAWVERRVIA